ncbi:GGDEF domain-containing protein [Massilia horti]|uniref:diguanylate cyclase n=1 Tax=Massilia horti TaxID=2562153 RepID=A0A4Y9SYG9_9BURK|nr:GGDEF domain-containing protein [Massilia horti]TFW31897.1 GGDEF domain-containing protein [Massilia horti]
MAAHQVGLFLNCAGERRTGFQTACGELFGRLFFADGAEAASDLLAGQRVDLLVIDLERYDPAIDLASLGRLVALRDRAPTLVLCPFTGARWLSKLMDFGPIHYAITPLSAGALCEVVERMLAGSPDQCGEATLQELLAVRSRVQQALLEPEDPNRMALALCQALCGWPGVRHAALFQLKEGDDLQLAAQIGADGPDLARVLQGGERLLQSPLRHAFPGLISAATGELMLLDALDKAGAPELVHALRGHGVEMALGLPIGCGESSAPRGSVSLLFGGRQRFAGEHLATLADLAQLVGVGLRMAEMHGESDQLLARVNQVTTTDALTGVANRRHGERLLEQEIRRARRYQLPLALLAFDIDRFKTINDQYGHPVGDVVLRAVADIARSVLRTNDVLVRSGGEEFRIIAPHTCAIDGLKIAEKVRQAIERAAVPGCDRVTVSLGVAQLGGQESGDALAVRAEAALARAKRAGRNCVELAMQ